MSLGKRLRQLREEKCLSQKELAEIIGTVSNNDLSRYEKGERSPHYKTLIQFANYFEVTLDYLVGRTDIRQPDPTAGLPEEFRNLAYDFINFLKTTYGKK